MSDAREVSRTSLPTSYSHADTGDAAELPLIAFAHKGNDWIRGSEQCLLDLLAGLDRSRFRLLVLANGRALIAESGRLGVEAIRIAHWGGGAITGAPWRLRMSRLLAAHRPALIHANMAVALPLITGAARSQRIPIVTHLHLPFASLGERHQALVRRSALIVGVAEHVVAPLRTEPAAADRVRVIHNAVNAGRLGSEREAVLRTMLGLPQGALIAASVGSLIRRKGHGVSILAVARARARGVDVHLLLCGDGEDERPLRTLAHELDVKPWVHFLGNRRDVGRVLRGTVDVLVSSAREEALPLSVMEAQWLGIPAIASDIPGHREVLGDGERGLLFPTDDVEALAQALATIAGDDARRVALGERGREHAYRAYGMPRYLSQFAALYEECLAASAREPARQTR